MKQHWKLFRTMYGYVFLGLCFIQKYALCEGYKNFKNNRSLIKTI